MANLTPKQERFVSEYLIDLNATQAAIRAGYSEDTSYSIGWENLKKPVIADAIQNAQKEAQERNKVTVDEITGYHRAAIELADEVNQPGALTGAANNLAKLHGLIVDQSVVKTELTGVIAVPLTPSEEQAEQGYE